MSKKKDPTLDDVLKVVEHKRASVGWVVGAKDSKVIRIARIAMVWPEDGAGRLRVAVTDWGEEGKDYPPRHYVSSASGGNYDKLTAALDGATVGGVTLGNHCDPAGDPRLEDLCHSRGWEWVRGYW